MSALLMQMLRLTSAWLAAFLVCGTVYADPYQDSPQKLGCLNSTCWMDLGVNYTDYQFTTWNGNWAPQLLVPAWGGPTNFTLTITSTAQWASQVGSGYYYDSNDENYLPIYISAAVGKRFIPLRVNNGGQYILRLKDTFEGGLGPWLVTGSSTSTITPNDIRNSIIPLPNKSFTVFSMSEGNLQDPTSLADKSCAGCFTPDDGSVVVVHNDSNTVLTIKSLSGNKIIEPHRASPVRVLLIKPSGTFVLVYDAGLDQWKDITPISVCDQEYLFQCE